jgi:putative transposase
MILLLSLGFDRRVDELVQAMGLGGISKSQVSKLCKDIDERVNAFLDRPIDGEWPYLWFDAVYLKVRDGGRIVVVAAIIAVMVTTEGRREIVGVGIGPSEAERFWAAFQKAWSNVASKASSWSFPMTTGSAPRDHLVHT